MKLKTVEQTKAMLAELLDSGLSCEAVGRRYGIGRSTVERNVKALIALAARQQGIEGLEEEGLESMPRLREHGSSVLAAVKSYQPPAMAPRKSQLSSEELAQGASRIRARSDNANRDVALMYVVFCTGAKPIELARLRVRDYLEVDGHTREESVMPASVALGGKARPLYFSSARLQEAVDAYLLERTRRKLGAGRKRGLFRGLDPDSALFLSEQGSGFELKARAQGDERVSCPLMIATLRATFLRAGWVGVTAQGARRQVATRLAEKGASEDQLCEVLGLGTRRSVKRLLSRTARPLAILASGLA